MASAYPAALDSFSTKTDGVTDVLAAHVNALQESVVAIQTELGTDPAGTLTNLKTRLVKSLDGAGNLNFNAATTLTIASGAITVTQNLHRVDTEAAASEDYLDTITATADGYFLLLHSVADARNVRIRHNVGNILCLSGMDIILETAADLALLIYDDAIDKWLAFGVTGAGMLNGTNNWTGPHRWNSGIAHTPRSVNTDVTLDTTYYVVRVDASGAARTITLPAAVAGNAGLEYVIKKADSSGNAVTVDGNGADTIDGATTITLAAQFDSLTIICSGADWMILASV